METFLVNFKLMNEAIFQIKEQVLVDVAAVKFMIADIDLCEIFNKVREKNVENTIFFILLCR